MVSKLIAFGSAIMALQCWVIFHLYGMMPVCGKLTACQISANGAIQKHLPFCLYILLFKKGYVNFINRKPAEKLWQGAGAPGCEF